MRLMNRSLTTSLAVATLSGLLSGPALAVTNEDFNFDHTSDLLHVCSVPVEAPEHVATALACTAFLEATVQYHDLSTARKKGKALVCIPSGVTVGDVRGIFLAWGEQHKNDKKLMAELPVNGVMRALYIKYPCKQK